MYSGFTSVLIENKWHSCFTSEAMQVCDVWYEMISKATGLKTGFEFVARCQAL